MGWNESKQRTRPTVHPQQQNSSSGGVSSLLQSKGHRTLEQPQRPQDQVRQSASVPEVGRINHIQVQRMTIGAERGLQTASKGGVGFSNLYYGVSPNAVRVSQPCHSPTCRSSMWYRMKQWESFFFFFGVPEICEQQAHWVMAMRYLLNCQK